MDDGAGGRRDALTVAYGFLNRRERTVQEVRGRLERAGCEASEIDAAIGELVEFGYLDDARFARLFAQDKRELESWGRERIARTLRERGIERGLIEAALGEQPAGGELERARELLARRFPGGVGADPRGRERAFGVLVRKGYNTEVAADAVRSFSAGG